MSVAEIDDNGNLPERRPNPSERRAGERKDNAALELKLMGLGYDEIAEVQGYSSARTAKVAVERALERNLMSRAEDTDDLRRMAAARYERLLRSVWPKAMNPGTEENPNPEHLIAVTKAADITDRFVKLHGLAAPTEIAIRTPTQQELEAWVAETTGIKEIEEGSIFDVEVIEEDEE